MQQTKRIWYLLPALFLAGASASAQVELGKEVVAAGGSLSGNGTHVLLGTVGQPCVGTMAAGAYRHLVGFLAPGILSASAIDDWLGIPEQVGLAQNYPNPFGRLTTIRYDLPESRHVRLEVFSMDGRRVACLIDEQRSAGRLAINWDGKNARGRPMPSGAYIYRMTAGDFSATYRMLLMR